MSTINANVADYLNRIETLTNTNLQILKTLNDSFFTKKNHIYAEVNDTTYVIPSFISLENKINALQENFENLVKSPEHGEAYFNFNGNTRAIEVRKYSHVPDSISLPTITTFSKENNDIFKDFLTPVPYINIELPTIPNDIVEVNVKKIVPKSDELKALFKDKLAYNNSESSEPQYKESVNCSFSEIYKNLFNYEEDKDYIEYDTIYKIPVRKSIGTSTYVIESVVSDVINEKLDEIITLKLRNNLSDASYNNKFTYKLFDETIEKPLQVGDCLTNYDGTGKVEIVEIRQATHTLVVRVVNGEFMNFIGTDTYDTNNDKNIYDLSKLRFHASIDFEKDKYIKVPLEEDKYVFVAVAVLNSRMNVQSSWGTGVLINTYALKDELGNDFKTYYENNVKNIGDVLFEMTSMITSPVSELTEDQFKSLSTLKPKLDTDIISVTQINKHLNNSDTVKNIRDAYNQKKVAQTQLSEVQTKINTINEQLASISFDDVTGTRSIYTAQLTKLNEQKNELMLSINNAIDSISLSVNSSEIPIENAKYRIRGFYIPNLDNVGDIDANSHIVGIQVQYRYKNTSAELGNATSISGLNGETYIYSDWNNMSSFNRSKIAKFENGNLRYNYEDRNENINEPSFNQIDIPISQGESVDIRIKAVYDFGQPYIKMTSDWSDIVNIAFPEEYAKDVPVLTIIEENNNDIETNRFNNILVNNGVDSHVKDTIIDQTTTYYHKPESIASGFYTAERRVIPLKDKLLSMSNDIASIKSDITNASANYRVSLAIGENDTQIYSDRENVITLEAYNNFVASGEQEVHDGTYTYKDNIVSTFINIVISNVGDTTMKLYSLFPGNRNIEINKSNSKAFDKMNYCYFEEDPETGEILDTNYGGVWFKYQVNKTGEEGNSMLQTQNQFIGFRINDVWTGEEYYTLEANRSTPKQHNIKTIEEFEAEDTTAMVIYPFVTTKYGLCIDSDDAKSYATINPGEELVIPMYCAYIVKDSNASIEKIISFDLRTSLYADPTNYSFTVVSKNTSSAQDKLTIANKKRFFDRLVNPVKYNTTVK